MEQINISLLSLCLMMLLPAIAIFVTYRENLNVTKDIVIALVRAIIQLSILGFILKIIFKVNNYGLTLFAVIFLVINASLNTKKRAKFKNATMISFISIGISYTILATSLVLTKTIEFIPSQFIPISGMIISNSMVSLNLCYRHLNEKFTSIDQEIIEKLSLGATAKQATSSLIKKTILLGIQPTIDSIKVLGIVSIPGMMSGLILAGLNPMNAIKYQIIVSFLLISTTIFTDSIGTYLAIKYHLRNKKY